MSGSGFDWDDMLLSMDWKEDWRNHINTLDGVPWEELEDATVDRLAYLHAGYDEDHPGEGQQTSPAVIEQFRRQDETSSEPSTATNDAQSARRWFARGPDSPEQPRPVSTVRQRPTAEHVPDASWRSKTDSPGVFTVGFELEVPIAMGRTGDLEADDPHPQAERYVANIFFGPATDQRVVKETIVDEVIRVLNMETDAVFTHKEADEGTEAYRARMDTLAELEDGVDKLARDEPSEGDPNLLDRALQVRGDSEDVGQSARNAFNTALKEGFTRTLEWDDKDWVELTEADIERALSLVRIGGVYAISDVQRATERFGELLRLKCYKEKQDYRHIKLRHMNPRYRAFSVYVMENMVHDGVQRSYYADQASEGAEPEKAYHWEVVKIASPVMEMEWPPKEIEGVIQQITMALREYFRIHRDVPSIPVSTQVTVSHSTGLNLLDIKKLITLVAILRDSGLVRLNRAHRDTLIYSNVCGPVKTQSSLGVMSYANVEVSESDPMQIIPRLDDDQQRHYLEIMEEHIPVEMIMPNGGTLSDRIFYGSLWMYTSIDDIVRAVNCGLPSRHAEVVTKCRGPGDTNEPVEDPKGETDPAMGINFNVVDAERGVFEFRQCGGSLDHQHIVSWLYVCAALTAMAKNSSSAEFKDTLIQIFENRISVMNALQIPAEVQQFYRAHIENGGYFEPADASVSWSDPFYSPIEHKI
ncbi:hypothetical protein F4804DRAFT_351913 [Jackrogersella minutella]|nr:hypothetical protein F4804DRAFT_351913 [Jackrogersella minutella]